VGELCLFPQRSQCQLSPGIEREGMVGADVLTVCGCCGEQNQVTSGVCYDIGAWHGIVDAPEQPPVEITSSLGRLLSISSQETIVRSFVRRETGRSRSSIASPTTHAKIGNIIPWTRHVTSDRPQHFLLKITLQIHATGQSTTVEVRRT
jgi:hypothetical protein